MKNFAVLASTNGTDMVVLREPSPYAKFSLVITNKECGALEKAKRWNIPRALIISKGKTRDEFEAGMQKELEKHNIDFIILIGFMRLLTESFVNKWKNKIMNIHPSLLPNFPGMDLDVHKEVLDHGCKVTGCTLHFVDSGMDTGPIILQAPVMISERETPETLKYKVQEKEQEIIFKAINLFAQDKLVVDGQKVRINY